MKTKMSNEYNLKKRIIRLYSLIALIKVTPIHSIEKWCSHEKESHKIAYKQFKINRLWLKAALAFGVNIR